MSRSPTREPRHDKPVTLRPLGFEEAVSGLLAVKPDPERPKRKGRKKSVPPGGGAEGALKNKGGASGR